MEPQNNNIQEVKPPETENVTTTPEPVVQPVVKEKSRDNKKVILVLIFVILLLIAGLIYALGRKPAETTTSTQTTTPSTKTVSETPKVTESKVEGLKLESKKNYGNKYSNGLLPVGDNKYVTDAAKKGYVYECQANFVPANQAGAQTRGPWFTNNNTQYDINKKAHINGSVSWTPSMTNTIQNGKRVIVTNDLPGHTTGVFPVASSDPARKYDANPNTIKSQSLTYNLTAEPTYGSPNCMGGEVGIMLTGVALFNAFDAGGRDAGAWEVQDSCDGHPQNKGEYHYHSLSSCITDQSVSKVIGFALDGFPITGPKVGENNILTTDDLDECHGIVSSISLDNKTVEMYHYVMTQDFPYSVSCFRATAVQAPGKPEH